MLSDKRPSSAFDGARERGWKLTVARLGVAEEGAGMSAEPQPGLAPGHMRPRYAKREPIMMTVDGQDFRIRERAEKPGEYDFDGLSGPHDYAPPGYPTLV